MGDGNEKPNKPLKIIYCHVDVEVSFFYAAKTTLFLHFFLDFDLHWVISASPISFSIFYELIFFFLVGTVH